jgi:CRISPR-associated protein Cas6
VDAQAEMIDVAFALEGETLPYEHRYALAEALQRALPWLESEPRAGVHRLNLVRSGSGAELISRRTRLMLRVPRSRADDTCALAGARLELGADRVRAGRAQPRELLPHGTLYAGLVAADSPDEAAFLERIQGELDAMGVRAQPVCGRWQAAEAGRLLGCSLMLTGLDPVQSLRLLQQGLGRHRRLGCGLFVPHRSAAAVGTPA